MSNYKSKFLQNCELDETILKKWGCDTLKYFIEKHNVPGRYYHTFNHIDEVIFEIEGYTDSISDDEYKTLVITALYHDIVYDPRRNDNEEESVKLFADNVASVRNGYEILDSKTVTDVCKLIRFTIYQRNPKNDLEHIFACCDLAIFEKDFTTQLIFEKQIQKEFAWVPLDIYVTERIKVLNKLHGLYYGNPENILCNTSKLVHYLQNKKWNVGVYFGSFNPLHKGHKSIITQSEKFFDKVIIAQGVSENIKSDIDQKIEWSISNECIQYSGLITDFIIEYPYDITIIRGIRNSDDLIYEQSFNKIIKDILPTQNFIYLFSDPEYNHISSSTIRKLSKYNTELIIKYL